MPTPAKENYLKALYHLHLKSPKISLTELGAELGVSKPTVNDMVKKMHQEDWVVYEKYKPIKLTAAGKRKAALIIRKHRLSEMFLSQVMGFGWEEVHDIAEEIEHLSSDKLFDRMDELLGFPTADPHGSPIPDKSGEVIRYNYKTLSEYREGDKIAIRALKDSSTEFLQFLNKRGLLLGTEVSINHIESFDKSMTVSYGIYEERTISISISNRLFVELV